MLRTRRSPRAGFLSFLVLVLPAGTALGFETESGAERTKAPEPHRPAATCVVPAGRDDTLQPRVVSPAPVRETRAVSDAARAHPVTVRTTLVEQLEELDPDRRSRAAIRLELLTGASATERDEARVVEALWGAGEHTEALERLGALEKRRNLAGVGIDWRGGRPVGGLRAPDVRIGAPRTDAWQVCLDFDAQSSGLFCVVRWGSTTGTSAWTVNRSSDGGMTWTETYAFASSVGIVTVSGAVVGGHLYIAYVPGGTPQEGRLRRCSVTDGAVDTAYGYQVVVDGGAVNVEEVALAANPDDFDNRIYYLALMNDDTIRYLWDAASDGRTFTDGGFPPSPAAEFGLDATYLHHLTGSEFLGVSYAASDGSIRVLLRDSSQWTERIVEPLAGGYRRTSISAYGDMIICAYEYAFASGAGVRYGASYDHGATWSNGNIAVPDGNFFFGYFEPEVGARGGHGTAIVYAAEAGEWDPAYYQFRYGYAPGPWSVRVEYNEFDVYTGSEMEACIMPPLSLGVWCLAGTYLVDTRIPYFDRMIDFAVDVPGPIGPTTGSRLLPVRPNPVSGETVIRFALPEAGALKLEVYDVAGRRVAMLADRTFDSGAHAIPLDARGLGSGVYFIVLRGEGRRDLETVIVRH